jgi:integrase
MQRGVRRTRTLGHVSEIPTKGEAWARVAALNLNPQPATENSDCLVRDVARRYDTERLMLLRPETRRAILSFLRARILPKWGAVPITALQPREVELWLRSLALSPRSRAHIRNVLHSLFEYSMWAGLVSIARNPMSLVRVQGVTARCRKPRVLSVEEFQKLTGELREPVRTLSIVCGCLGLRVSEGLGLRWSDLDWLSGAIKIERSCVRQKIGECKTQGSRKRLSLTPELAQVLQAWRQQSQFTEPQDWVFASALMHGKQPISYTEIRRELKRASAEAGIAPVSSHSFRHSFRTWLDSTGAPIGVQQRAMRHSSVTTTMNVYGDALPDDLRQAYAQVAALALARMDCGK